MPDNVDRKEKTFQAKLDTYVYVKNGHSFLVHLVPFSIAALLLLVTSVPSDNMLLKLATKLREPSWTWLPAGILTVVTGLSYITSLYLEIRIRYLRSDHDYRRTCLTAFLYIILCSLMAYSVLPWEATRQREFEALWACALLALLSLNGVGWKGPSAWVKLIDKRAPDYSDGRIYAQRLANVVRSVRDRTSADKKDIDNFRDAAKQLADNIDKNIDFEPAWARANLERVADALRILLEQVDQHFGEPDASARGDFVAACRCQKQSQYGKFVEALKILGGYFPELSCT
jgi:hypothetical protein